MIEMITKDGKKVGTISDSSEFKDSLIVKGRSINLDDVYKSEELADAFNTQVKELNDDKSENDYTRRFTG